MDFVKSALKEVFWPYGASSSKRTYFRCFNNLVAWAHFVQLIAVAVVYETKIKNIPPDMIFVSGIVNLTFPNHMIHVFDGSADRTKCSLAADVLNSSAYRSVKHWDNGDVKVPGLGDSLLLDLTNTTLVEYYDTSYSLNTSGLIMAFFLMSWAFQLFNGWYLEQHPDGPHYVQYIEYSLSSSLTLVVMALNTGIQDLFTILTLFALFFGMNIFGTIAEFMMHMAEKWSPLTIDILGVLDLYSMWLIPHLCGWVLFLFAWLPVAIKFTRISGCSKNAQSDGVPWFIRLAVILESLCYFLFGLLQFLVLWGRMHELRGSQSVLGRIFSFLNFLCPRLQWKEWLNWNTVLLSLCAKTFLAWVLLGPVLVSN